MTLTDLTGAASGIILYEDMTCAYVKWDRCRNDEVIVLDFTRKRPCKRWTEPLYITNEDTVSLGTLLSRYNLLYDRQGRLAKHLKAHPNGTGTVYYLFSGKKVITIEQ